MARGSAPADPARIPTLAAVALLLVAVLAMSPSTNALQTPPLPGDKVEVTFDERSMIIGGERVLLMSGGIHYVRTPPADWPRLFGLWKELGFNTVQTCKHAAAVRHT